MTRAPENEFHRTKNLMTTVAIIEDNSTMRKMLVELIDSAPGYRCLCACASSKEALVEVPKHQPDVVLMDIHLPDESGITCTAKLTEKLPGLQVIMVTVYKDTDLIFQALKIYLGDGQFGFRAQELNPDLLKVHCVVLRDGRLELQPGNG